MTTKLTLSINKEVVKKAKRIAQTRGKSVSKMIEEFIGSLPEKDAADKTAVDKIKNIINGKITHPKIDWKKTKEERLTDKYGI
ncbi:antitoxin [Segetibacter sp. 3557_3]|uniref:DUF6364 family protein n=1 Tax=Segetibacter sp. 3557_3 TaxID=2547429 RepID=UPI0010585142|nr:DUF6364 family protein [Segetibacter sp. 3557_3]TDH26797.1 antitoxin [Segetibacter sp. 3557_3]